MSWQQIHLQCTPNQVDLAEALFYENQAVSILLEDAGDEPLFEPMPGEEPLWGNIILTAIFDTNSDNSYDLAQTDFQTLAQEIAAEVGASRVWLSCLDDKDWTKEWMTHYKPIKCQGNLWIVPKWLNAPDASAINLILDPGLAFGTGYHATTRLCLDWLAEQDLTNKTVIDYGCGSGILGVGALLLGAKVVYAVDIDPQAVLATRQNAQLNGVADRLHAFLPEEFKEFWQTQSDNADIITANILAKPLIHFAPYFANLLKNQGQIVLAGLIENQVADVVNAYQPYFKIDEPYQYNAPEDKHWCRLSAKKYA